MRLVDWLTITAILLGPIIAIRITRYLEKRRDDYGRKERIFKTLMATRATRLAGDHVQALNLIDVEFYDKGIWPRHRKNKAVVEAWKEYLDLLGNKPLNEKSFAVWTSKLDDLFIELMYKMSIALGYDFDRTAIKNTSYMPTAHGTELDEQAVIRKGFAAIFRGEAALPMEWIQPDPSPEELERRKAEQERQAKQNQLLEDYLLGKIPMRAIIVGDESGRLSANEAATLRGEEPKN